MQTEPVCDAVGEGANEGEIEIDVGALEDAKWSGLIDYRVDCGDSHVGAQLEDDPGREARQCLSKPGEDREVALMGWEDPAEEVRKDLAVNDHREVDEAQRREAEVGRVLDVLHIPEYHDSSRKHNK
jgi:hypothetical protein